MHVEEWTFADALSTVDDTHLLVKADQTEHIKDILQEEVSLRCISSRSMLERRLEME